MTDTPMVLRPIVLMLLLAVGSAASAAAPLPADARAAAIAPRVGALVDEVESWFGAALPRDFTLRVFGDRASLDAYWQGAWQAPGFKSECWMVASGTGSELVMLDPAVWSTQACEHEATDVHTRQILLHELVHVYHGQHSPDPEFERQEPISWFVEGLAVLVSGQLDAARRAAATAALAAGQGPKQLEDAWKGKDRYGFSGMLVEAVEAKVGRKGMLALLANTDEATLLAAAKIGEPQLLTTLSAAR